MLHQWVVNNCQVLTHVFSNLSNSLCRVSAEQKAEVEAAIEPVKKAIEAEDYEAMKTTLDALNEKMQAAATEMYAQAQPGAEEGAPGADAGSEKKADDVEEADFEMMDDEDKK